MRVRSFNHSVIGLVAVLAIAAAIAGAGAAAGAAGGGKPKHYSLAPKAPVTTTATISRTVPRGKRFLLYDMIFQNPAADLGRLVLKRGGQTLLTLGLQNFRTQQHSLQAPISFGHAQKIRLFIDCDNPSGGCTPAALLTGRLKG